MLNSLRVDRIRDAATVLRRVDAARAAFHAWTLHIGAGAVADHAHEEFREAFGTASSEFNEWYDHAAPASSGSHRTERELRALNLGFRCLLDAVDYEYVAVSLAMSDDPSARRTGERAGGNGWSVWEAVRPGLGHITAGQAGITDLEIAILNAFLGSVDSLKAFSAVHAVEANDCRLRAGYAC